MASFLTIIVTHRHTTHTVTLADNATLAALHNVLENLTGVPVSVQKLLYKGRLTTDLDTSLVAAGLRDRMRIQMVGVTSDELTGLRAAETTHERMIQERAVRPPTKLRATGAANVQNQYRIHRVEPLSHLPNPAAAHALLTRLAEDPAILHTMRKHRLSVGVLTELAPHEHPGLLGLNEIRGTRVRLRLRTDRYDGFRLYADVRRVLCHELAHNVQQAHNEEFKQLNSLLNREVLEAEQGARRLGDCRGVTEVEVHSHVLGGGDGVRTENSVDQRRQRVVEATVRRLRREEEDVERGCGT